MLIDDSGRQVPRTHQTAGLLCAVTLLLSACSAAGDDAEAPQPEDPIHTDLVSPSSYNAQPRDAIADGGEFATALDFWPRQFNPFHKAASAHAADVWNWYGPQLALTDWKGQWHYNAEFLDNVEAEVKDGKTVVTYTIDRNAKFVDNTDLDWEAFAATWHANSGADPNFESALTNVYSRIESVQPGASHNQAVVTFTNTVENWQRYFPTVLHPAVDTAEEFNSGFVNNLPREWGSGPFALVTIDAEAGAIVFQRSDNWWSEPAKLEKRRFIQVDAADALTAFRGGKINALDVSIRERMTSARGMEGVDILEGVAPTRRLFLLDANSRPLRDPSVRRAIFAATNRKQILTSRYEGIPAAQEPPNSLMYFPWQTGYQDNLSATVDFDPEQAKTLLDDAGWKPGTDGIRRKAGQRLEISIPATDRTDSARAAQKLLQQQLHEIGVALELVERPGQDALALFGTEQDGRAFNGALVVQEARFADGVANLDDVTGPGGLLERTGIDNAALRQHVAGLCTEFDSGKQLARGRQAEHALFSQLTILPMSILPGEVAVKRGLTNYGPAAFAQLPVQDVGWEL